MVALYKCLRSSGAGRLSIATYVVDILNCYRSYCQLSWNFIVTIIVRHAKGGKILVH